MRPVLFACAVLLAAPAFAQSAFSSVCAEAQRGQFDFWVGRWDVYPTGKDKLVARSLIEKLYGGCAIRENFQMAGGQEVARTR